MFHEHGYDALGRLPFASWNLPAEALGDMPSQTRIGVGYSATRKHMFDAATKRQASSNGGVLLSLARYAYDALGNVSSRLGGPCDIEHRLTCASEGWWRRT